MNDQEKVSYVRGMNFIVEFLCNLNNSAHTRSIESICAWAFKEGRKR